MKHLSHFFLLMLLTAGFSQVALSDDSTAEQPTIVQAASLVTTSFSCQSRDTGKYYAVSFLNMEGASTPENASQAVLERYGVGNTFCQSVADLISNSTKSGQTANLSDNNIANSVVHQLDVLDSTAQHSGPASVGYRRSELLNRDVYVSELSDSSLNSASGRAKATQMIVWVLASSVVGMLIGGTSLVPVAVSIGVGIALGSLAMALDSHFGATKAFVMAGLKLGHNYILHPIYTRAWSYLLKPGLYYSLSGILYVLHWFAPEGIQTVQDYILPKLAPAAKFVVKVN